LLNILTRPRSHGASSQSCCLLVQFHFSSRCPAFSRQKYMAGNISIGALEISMSIHPD
jgi:hypothetical protein